MFKRLLTLWLCLGLACSPVIVFSQNTPSPGAGWVSGISTTGQRVWFGPGHLVKTSAGMGQMLYESAISTGGAKFASTTRLAAGAGEIVVVGRSVVTGASVFAGFRAVATGPLGIALIAVPAVIDWLATSDLRPSPNSDPSKPLSFEKKDPNSYPACASNCLEYGFTRSAPWFKSPGAAGSWYVSQFTNDVHVNYTYLGLSGPKAFRYQETHPKEPRFDKIHTYNLDTRWTAAYDSSETWLPQSMDDISPYMSARPISGSAIQALIDKGAQLPLTSPSVTGPASVTSPSVVQTTPVPVPPPEISTSTVTGNPNSLSANTPTVTSSSTGSISVSVNGNPVSIPTKSTTTSTYNPTTNQTTSQTVTSSDPHTVTTTTTPTSTIEYSTGLDPNGNTVPKVTSTTSSNTSTTVTNNTTNTSTTTTSTETRPQPAPDANPKPAPAETPDLCALHPQIVACASVDDVDMCKKYPDSLACKKTDEPEVPDLETLEKPISFSPDAGWGGTGGSCPAPRHLSSGTGADFSFTPYCDFMTALRPVFVSVAWLSGAMILIGANRKE